MTLLIGSWTVGLILAILALGVFISFRIFAFPDITADGSLTLGAAVAAALIVRGYSPWAATAAAMLAGALAGGTTGVLHTRFRINGLLAGILVATALYSVNLHVMGRSNIPLLDARTVGTDLVDAVAKVSGPVETVRLLGREVRFRDAVNLAAVGLLVAALAWVLRTFLRTGLGTAMRATGDNPRMIRALGVDVGRMITLGLMMSNALVALSGAILAQYQGFADIQMGIGMIVWGLASVILGQALVGTGGLGLSICGAVLGSLLFRLMVALALRRGLDPNDLKLITAAFVFAALVLPKVFAGRTRPSPGGLAVWGASDHGVARAARGLQDVQPRYPRRGPRPAGRRPDGRAGELRRRDRDQRLGQEHDAELGRRIVPGRRRHDPAGRPGDHRLAGAPPRAADRPGLSGPAGRHLAVALDRREPRPGRPAGPSPRPRPGGVPAQARRVPRPGQAAGDGPGRPARQPDRQPLRRPAPGADPAHGHLPAPRAAPARRAHRRPRPPERRAGHPAHRPGRPPRAPHHA